MILKKNEFIFEYWRGKQEKYIANMHYILGDDIYQAIYNSGLNLLYLYKYNKECSEPMPDRNELAQFYLKEGEVCIDSIYIDLKKILKKHIYKIFD